MNSIKSWFSLRFGLVAAAGVFTLTLGVLALAPRSIGTTKAENCNNAPTVATLNSTFPVSWGSVTGSDCTNAPTMAIRNANGGTYSTSAEAQNGDELRVRVYVHNEAQQGLDYYQTTAFNVGGNISVSGNTVYMTAAGSNTNTISGNVSVNLPSGATLELIPGSEEFYDYQANRIYDGSASLNGQNGIFNLGNMQGCFEFSKFFVFRVRVVGQQSTNLDGDINARLNGKVNGQCLYKGLVSWSTSGVSAAQVTVRDPETGAESLFSGEINKTDDHADWLQPGQNYRFTLWNTMSGSRQHLAETWLVVPEDNCAGPTPTEVTGQISAQLGAQITGQCLYNGTVSWQTSGASEVNVTVRDPETGSENLYSTDLSNGSSPAPWLEPNKSYRFTLWNVVNGQRQHLDEAWVTAGNDNFCRAEENKTSSLEANYTSAISGQCMYNGYVKWQTSGYTWVQVTVSDLDDATGEIIHSHDLSGNNTTPWLTPGHRYVYKLYDAIQSPVLLKQVSFTVPNLNCGNPPGETPAVVCTPSTQTAQTFSPVEFTATGGDGQNYSWSSPQATKTSGQGRDYSTSYAQNGSYTVTVTSGGKSATCGATITTPAPTTLVCTPASQEVNVNQPTFFSVSGGNGNYTWSAPGSSRTDGTGSSFSTSYNSAGNRTVTVVSGSQTANCGVKVNQPTTPNPALVCSPSSQTVKVNQFAYFSASGGNGNYTWSAPAGSPANGNGNSFSSKFGSAGNKIVTVISGTETKNCNVTVEEETIPQSANMELVKTVKNITQNTDYSHSVSAKQNDIVEYKIFVRATSAVNLVNVRVTDQMPFGLSYESDSLRVDGQTHAPGLTSGGLVFSSVSQSGVTITYRARVNVNSGTLVNNAQSTADNASGKQDSATVNVTFVTPGQPSLSITKEVKNLGPSQTTDFASSINAKKNDNVQYRIIVRNLGSASANEVFVSDSNPMGVSISSLSVSKSYSGTIQTGIALGNLAAGESVTITYNARVEMEQGTVQNIATVSAQNAASKQAIAVVTVIKDQTTTGGGTCNNATNSCNTNTNTNTQSNNNSTNSSNQSNNTNINGNNNTVTNSNQNCVNNSCNNTNIVYINQGGNTIPANEYRQLSINKNVRAINGGAFQNSVTVGQNDTVEFEIVVSNTGNQVVNNVRVNDNLGGNLSLVYGTIRVDGSYVSDNLNGISLGSLFSGQQKRVTFQARVNSYAGQSVQNIAYASGDSASQVQDDAWVFIQGSVQGGNVNLVYSKRAWNDTKNADATSQIASREDYITYTLTATNSGNSPANNFIITDDLSQVLPYADMVDNGGGVLSGNVISFPGITIPANGSVSKSFKVRVKFSLASNLSYSMVNTYGNTITVRINTPQVLGAFVAPKTGGPTVGLASIFGSLMAGGLAVIRNRRKVWELLWD